ncbi:hypothetical protein BDR05DRAFT_1001564 [Suillus weaverae]|nr:hypothetical protein BDR05DRAFT_1001564 [Suillus weaverae]
MFAIGAAPSHSSTFSQSRAGPSSSFDPTVPSNSIPHASHQLSQPRNVLANSTLLRLFEGRSGLQQWDLGMWSFWLLLYVTWAQLIYMQRHPNQLAGLLCGHGRHHSFSNDLTSPNINLLLLLTDLWLCCPHVDLYHRVYEELLAVPVIPGIKFKKEKFISALYTATIEGWDGGSCALANTVLRKVWKVRLKREGTTAGWRAQQGEYTYRPNYYGAYQPQPQVAATASPAQ